MKVRKFPRSNYKAIHFNGKTIRIAIDPSKPITELDFPEFYDVKLTSKCRGNCPYCYMASEPHHHHAVDTVQKIKSFFGNMDKNQRPFQVALGGGEPTESPYFAGALKAFYDLGITPNYTTNGMWTDFEYVPFQNVINATKKYCGGVAVSCHPHLQKYWEDAALLYHINGIKLNFHIIISDAESCERFREIYDLWEERVDYFVLLPYIEQGRAEKKEIDWEYLVSILPEDTSKLAFGAHFYPFLLSHPGNLNVSLYEPEIMSKFLDLTDMRLYKSSFELGD
jgi:organic radical activating enzyme